MTSIIKICGITLFAILSFTLSGQNNIFTAGYKNDSIYFTDIIPDTTLHDDYGEGPFGRDLDFDNDGTNDFRIEVYLSPTLGWVTTYVEVIPYGENRIAYSHIDTSAINECNSDTIYRRVAQIFNFGDTIDETLKYTKYYATLTETEWCAIYNLYIFNIKDWIGIGERYIGGYIKKNDTISYCWILVQVNMEQSVTIKEYAVNINKPNGNDEFQNDVPDFSVYPNPAINRVTISKKNELNNSYIIEIKDNTGRTVLQNKMEKWEKSQMLDVSFLKAGMYQLFISGNNIITNRKLIIF